MSGRDFVTGSRFWRVLLAMAVVLAVGCQAPVSEEERKAAATAQRVAALLAKGQAALQAKQIVAPENDNALAYFREVQALAPGNPEVQTGFATIFNHLLDQARTAHNGGDFTQALALLDQAESIQEPTPLSQAMRKQTADEQLRLFNAAKAKTQPKTKQPSGVEYLLSIDGLNKRDERITSRIKSIAEHTRTVKGAIRIEARNDAEGRWIFEQMRLAEPQYSFRVEYNRSQRPKIVVFKDSK